MRSQLVRGAGATAVALAMTVTMTTAASAKTPKPATARFDVTSTQRSVAEPTTNAPMPNATVTLPIVLNKRAPRGGVAVSYTIGEGTATAGADFTPAGGQAVVPGGKKKATLTFTLRPDTTVEDDETLTVRLTGASAGAVIGTPSTVNFTIIDDDPYDPYPPGGVTVTECTASDPPPIGDVKWSQAAVPFTITGYDVLFYNRDQLIGRKEVGPDARSARFSLTTPSFFSVSAVVYPVTTNAQPTPGTKACQMIVE